MPVARVVLSHPLAIFALVGRYPANKLIAREPLPRRNSFPDKEMPPRQIARYYPSVRKAIPVPEVGYPRLTAPFATSPRSKPLGFVRLACLIHAANVRSEPGSNPSINVRYRKDTRGAYATPLAFRFSPYLCPTRRLRSKVYFTYQKAFEPP